MMDNDAFLARDFIRGDPKLEVVKELLLKELGDKLRKDGTPEVDHSILVSNLRDWYGQKQLQELGPESEEGRKFAQELQVQKAVALLHDILEESPRYHPTQDQLAEIDARLGKGEHAYHEKDHLAHQAAAQFRTDLIEALEKKETALAGGRELTVDEKKDLESWADKVFGGVMALTHKTSVQRFDKVDEARRLDKQWRPIKAFDQSASIVGDILHYNREGVTDFKPTKQLALMRMLMSQRADTTGASQAVQLLSGMKRNQRVALKSIDVSRAVSEGNENDPYHEFTKRCYNTFAKIYDLTKKQGKVSEAAKVQKAFNIVDTLEASYAARGSQRVRVNAPHVIHYERGPLLDPVHGGITDIVVLAEDPRKVVSFSMWEGDGVVDANWGKDGKPHGKPNAATLSDILVKRLETISGIKLNTGVREDSVREFTVNNDDAHPNNRALHLITLLSAATGRGNRAVDASYVSKIKAQRDAESQLPSPGGGPQGEAESLNRVQMKTRLENQQFNEIMSMLQVPMRPSTWHRRGKSHERLGPTPGEEPPSGTIQRT